MALTPSSGRQSGAASSHGTALSTQGGGQWAPFPSPRGAQPLGVEPRLQAPLLAGHSCSRAVRPWRPLTSLGKPGRNQGPLGDQARAGCGQGSQGQRPWVCNYFRDLHHQRVKTEAIVPPTPLIWRREFAGEVSHRCGDPETS